MSPTPTRPKRFCKAIRPCSLLEDRDAAAARAAFLEDITVFSIIELDRFTCDAAADIAEITGVRTLDALHLAAARRAGGSAATRPRISKDLKTL